MSPLPVTPQAQQQACARTAAYPRQKGGWITQRNLERAMFLFLPLGIALYIPIYFHLAMRRP